MTDYIKAHPIKFAIFAVLVLLSLRVLVWGGLNMTGFCWADKRWLNDEEKIVKVLEFLNTADSLRIFADHPKPGNSVINEYEEFKIVPYRDIHDLRTQNTDCCNFGHDSVQSLSGDSANDSLHVKLRIQYLDRNNQMQRKTIDTIVTYNNCASAIGVGNELRWYQ